MTMPTPAPDSAALEALRAARQARMQAGLARRYRADSLFRWLGLGAVTFSGLVLVFLLVAMASNGWAGFQRSEIKLAVPISSAVQVDPQRLAQPDPLGALELAGLAADPAQDAAAIESLAAAYTETAAALAGLRHG